MKTLFKLLLCLSFSSVFQSSAITFESSTLNDVSEPSYLTFHNPARNPAVTFETISADFNGDGSDDILSLGGKTSNFGTGGITFAIPLAMKLYDNGEFKLHDLGVSFPSAVVNVIDIDKDGDLDIVTLSGYILINDGLANFTTVRYNYQWVPGNNVFTFDWDNDGDLDIITQTRVYLNNGQLDFSENIPWPNFILQGDSEQVFNYSDINHDDRIDLVVTDGTILQTWMKDGQGNLNLTNQIAFGNRISKIHALPPTNGKQNFVAVTTGAQGLENLYYLTNNGHGVFTYVELNVELSSIGSGNIEFTKFFNVDLNNDGRVEVVASANYTDNSDCSNAQSLVFVFEKNENNDWELKRKLYSDGYKSQGFQWQYSMGKFFLPTIVDLNADNLPDIIQQGDKTMVWLNKSSATDGFVFKLSNKSIAQFNKNIDVVDFDNDSNVDIFMAAQYQHSCTSPDLIYTPENFVTSTLWKNQGNGTFAPFLSPIGGGNDFLRPYEYAIFADLEGNSEQNLIVTSPATDNSSRISRYVYPRIVDPGLSYDLPEVTLNAKTAQLVSSSNKRQIVMIADTEEAPIIISRLAGSAGLVEVGRLDFGARDGEFKLADIDGDGSIDIVASTKGESDAITIWYNDGLMNFTQSASFSHHSYGIAVIDMNNDGRKDIFVGNAANDIWLNMGNRLFEKQQYNSNLLWSTPFGLPFGVYTVPKDISVVDINNDGKEDIIFSNNKDYFVFINNSSLENIDFYMVYYTDVAYTSSDFNKVITDIDGDGKKDFVVGVNNRIEIFKQVQESISTGLYFDPTHNGHGFSIDEIGRDNLYYSVFYSYTNDGSPIWFSGLSRHVGMKRNLSIESSYLTSLGGSLPMAYQYDYGNHSATINPIPDFEGYILANNPLSNGGSLNKLTYKVGDEFASWNIQEIIPFAQRPQNDLSGHWWAGENDSGWGISLNFKENDGIQTVVATMYFYDEEGQPVWVIGTQEGFELNQDITINMDKVNGYGRLQNSVELTRVPAGTITINLKQASQNLSDAGRLTMNIHYPDDAQNNNWVRSSIPFGLLSKPR